jgi:hypothetical protein
MTITTHTVLYSYTSTKLEVMIKLTGRDKSAFDAYCLFENCNWNFDFQIGIHSLQADLQNLLLYVFFSSQKIIQERLPSLLPMHGRKFCIISYLIYSLVPALGRQCHHFVPEDIGIILSCNTSKAECAIHRNGKQMQLEYGTYFIHKVHREWTHAQW